MTSSDRVTIDVSDAVADVRLNRPEKMNALDEAMFDALGAAAEGLVTRRDVRCVVLSGEGSAFCSGLDRSRFEQMSDREPGTAGPLGAVAPGSVTSHAQQAVFGWTQLPMPVIAAVHGFALGGGIQLALGADFRIVAPDAQLSVLEIKWGLTPDMTGIRRLVEAVGIDVAKELTFTGRFVTGTEAAQIGLATRVEDNPHDAALAMARDIAECSPDAIRAAKRLFRAVDLSEVELFALERHEIGGLIGTPNQTEAVLAALEQRAPRFYDGR